MQKNETLQAQVAKKIQECLKEFGFAPEVRVSTHEGLVTARKLVDDQCIRVVLHITDREPTSSAAGPAAKEVANVRRVQMAIRPTLATRSAQRTGTEGEKDKECE